MCTCTLNQTMFKARPTITTITVLKSISTWIIQYWSARFPDQFLDIDLLQSPVDVWSSNVISLAWPRSTRHEISCMCLVHSGVQEQTTVLTRTARLAEKYAGYCDYFCQLQFMHFIFTVKFIYIPAILHLTILQFLLYVWWIVQLNHLPIINCFEVDSKCVHEYCRHDLRH